jgi:hypothetical protein
MVAATHALVGIHTRCAALRNQNFIGAQTTFFFLSNFSSIKT